MDNMRMLGIKIAIAEMKNYKALVDDEITVVMMKAAQPIGMQCVYVYIIIRKI
jgi:putative transposon-encoded protein